MSHKAEWTKKAEILLLTDKPADVAEYLYPSSGYTSFRAFRNKVYALALLIRKKESLKDEYAKTSGELVKLTGDYKETRLPDGTIRIVDVVERKLSDAELFDRYGRSMQTWRISMVWFKDKASGGYLLSCSFIPLEKTPDNTIKINNDFLKDIKKISSVKVKKQPTTKKPKALLLIAKQDAHLNKYDIGGNNNIEDRFDSLFDKLQDQLDKAISLNNLDEIVYVVGSDEFNSEWTGLTTKGTPQKNILTHQQAFEKITGFNIRIIKHLLTYSSKVKVVLLNGNHDHNVGWHLANVLKHVFTQLIVDDSLNNTKVLSWNRNLILINHGDELKPKDLAVKFPMIANDKWSSHDSYFVITGDKHHEVAHDFNGILTYQLPQLSKARSDWDDKKVHITSKAELVTFLFEVDGMSTILKSRM